jgi:hypothetical protein
VKAKDILEAQIEEVAAYRVVGYDELFSTKDEAVNWLIGQHSWLGVIGVIAGAVAVTLGVGVFL